MSFYPELDTNEMFDFFSNHMTEITNRMSDIIITAADESNVFAINGVVQSVDSMIGILEMMKERALIVKGTMKEVDLDSDWEQNFDDSIDIEI